MGVEHRRRHQLGSVIGRISKHDSLVTCSLFIGFLPISSRRIDTLLNIRGLLPKHIDQEGALFEFAGVGIFGSFRIVRVISNPPQGILNHSAVIKNSTGGDLSRQSHHIVFHECFAGNTAPGILFETGIKNRIRNGITHLVGMTFGYRLGRKYE